MQFTSDLKICRLLNGMWQVSGAHGHINSEKALQEMIFYHEGGFTTWDLADHYGPAEDFIGAFRKRLADELGSEELKNVQAFTKWVPRPTAMPRSVVEKAIDISRARMGVEILDVLQFHWWDYNRSAYLDALHVMEELRDEGKIRHLALTNFDTQRVRRIIDAGIQIVSNQIQFSVIDRRPEVEMIPFCTKKGIFLLSYGTLCGGLLSKRYLNRPEPRGWELNTASLQKYKRMIDAWGGWQLFQELLRVLDTIAEKKQVSISNVATRYILDKPAVAGIIVGARLGIREHRQENARVFNFSLEQDDLELIELVTRKSNDLFKIIGDCGDEYR